jgi:transcription-repair coupling factor (superfamily II helicase)
MILENIKRLPAFQQLTAGLQQKKSGPGLALPRAARLPVAISLSQTIEVPCLYITDRVDHALALLEESAFWAKEMPFLFFSEPTPMFYEDAAWDQQTRLERLQVLGRLAEYFTLPPRSMDMAPFIITTVRAVMTRTLPKRDFLKACKTYRLEQEINPEAIQKHLADIGFQAEEVVLTAGQFSRRGGILDVWPMLQTLPVRMEFFGDSIETIRSFNPATQRTVENLREVFLTPARELLPLRAREQESPLPWSNEFHIAEAYSQTDSIIEYLTPDTLILMDDQSIAEQLANEIEEQAIQLRAENVQAKYLAPEFPIPYFTWSEVNDDIQHYRWLELGFSTSEQPSSLAQCFEVGQRFSGHLKQFIEVVGNEVESAQPVWIVSRQIGRIKELWDAQKSKDELTNEPQFIEATLGEGWKLKTPEGELVYLYTDNEIFGWERPLPRQRTRQGANSPEDVFSDLKPGDWVAHIDHGIGRFQGLVRRSLEGAEKEFLSIEYDGGDQIFVPIYQADRITRYIGPDERPPNAAHIGTPDWNSNKQRVREAVRQVARELLELYARRQIASGFAFHIDSTWQQELEASFPYIETADQKKAIEETKRDMEDNRPMDRLLCGDVGYGKTEVALRAAFKAVNDGKQVALLVPTTVLAQQHYETFGQRLEPFPVTVEMLSRFRTPREQQVVLSRLSKGEIDIVIGTHRLIQSDVHFKDLGLVIIDEEQRFGVTHKEYLKKLRTEVDVLTLTATPIPRTLYMALTGVRDISMINTPPAERQPIITHIGPYSPHLVRQAIVRELERGGQVFFVHNRVQTIKAMRSHLQNLVPEARIGIAHGQMPENELANVMHQFVHGQIDVLLCTSIIESGLDIPNANTLIVDRGDTFGLAQLYQLRGRVGRGAQRAYAYFFRHRRKLPTREGQERLEIIAEHTQLGSGYSIAMRDLEMRGAGDLLGTRQHGYIAAVGFHLYTKLLAQAVREIRNAAGLPELAKQLDAIREIPSLVSVDLPLSITIPFDYVPDQGMRLKLYRRLAELESDEELEAMQEEFEDRFGAFPQEVNNLFYYLTVKIRANLAGLSSVGLEDDQIVLRFPSLPEERPARKLPDLKKARAGKNSYWMEYSPDDPHWQKKVLDVLEQIIEQRIF